MKGMRSKAAAGGMDIDFGDVLYNEALDLGNDDVPMMEGDPAEKVVPDMKFFNNFGDLFEDDVWK